MERIYTADATRLIERKTMQENNIPSVRLMEQAGSLIAYSMLEEISDISSKKICVVIGKGNNGGDGLVIARYLSARLDNLSQIKVVLVDEKARELGDKIDSDDKLEALKDILSKESFTNMVTAYKLGISVHVASEENSYYDQANIIVDALFGIGITREIKGIYSYIIGEFNNSKAKVYSVDLPSGINTDTGKVMGQAVKADVTYALGVKKLGHLLYPGKAHAGRVKFIDLSFDKKAVEKIDKDSYAVTLNNKELASFISPRRPDSNKGSYGRLLVVAGSDGMPGAALLASESAYRMGCGFVSLSSPKSVTNLAVVKLPELLINNDYNILNFRNYNAMLIGPGLGQGQASRDRFEAIVSHKPSDLLTIIDADGLNILAEMVNELEKAENDGLNPNAGRIELNNNDDSRKLANRMLLINKIAGDNIILTPHKKELSRLLNVSMEEIDFLKIGSLASTYLKGCLVMKDSVTMVASEEGIYLNQSGNDGLSVAGSGDVLAGIIAGLVTTSAGASAKQVNEALVKQSIVANTMQGNAIAGDNNQYQGILSNSAKLGVYIHGKIADELLKIKASASIIPSDLVEYIKNNNYLQLFNE